MNIRLGAWVQNAGQTALLARVGFPGRPARLGLSFFQNARGKPARLTLAVLCVFAISLSACSKEDAPPNSDSGSTTDKVSAAATQAGDDAKTIAQKAQDKSGGAQSPGPAVLRGPQGGYIQRNKQGGR